MLEITLDLIIQISPSKLFMQQVIQMPAGKSAPSPNWETTFILAGAEQKGLHKETLLKEAGQVAQWNSIICLTSGPCAKRRQEAKQ